MEVWSPYSPSLRVPKWIRKEEEEEEEVGDCGEVVGLSYVPSPSTFS